MLDVAVYSEQFVVIEEIVIRFLCFIDKRILVICVWSFIRQTLIVNNS